MKKIKKEDEGEEIPAEIKKENEGTVHPVTVTRTTLNFSDAEGLSPGDLISHVRIMKIISIKFFSDKSATLELEIIKRNWNKY